MKEPSSKELSKSYEITAYTTNSETKAAFAEPSIRFFKNIFDKHLEKNWSYRYIKELQSFVNRINSRINRVTGLAPNKVSTKHISNLVSHTAQQSSKLIRKPNLKPVDKVGVAKQDLPFKKRVQATHHWRGIPVYPVPRPELQRSSNPLICWLTLTEKTIRGSFTSQSWQKLGRNGWEWHTIRVSRFNRNLSTKHNGILSQRVRRSCTTRARLESGFGWNNIPNKCQCYHRRVLRIQTQNSS